MAKLLISIVSFCLLFQIPAWAQLSLPDSGFTDKSKAQNLFKDSLKDGKWVENVDAQGNVTSAKNAPYYSLTVYYKGKPVGMSRYYFKDNKLAVEMPYDSSGKKDGTGKLYYESGKLLKKIVFSHGRVIGYDSLFYESGALEIVIPYMNGKKNGMGKLFYPDGKVETLTPYMDNMEHGMIKVYYENGFLKSEIPMEKNKREGTQRDYYDNGSVKTEITFSNDKQVGQIKNYDRMGNEIK